MSEETSLSQFVRNNSHLIASLGVFGALTTLFTKIDNAQYLSFVSFAIFFVLMWEFLEQFPEIKISSIRFIAFEMLTATLLIFVALYMFVTYVAVFWKLFVFMSIFVIYSAVSVYLYLKLKLFERIEKVRSEKMRSVTKIVILLAVMGVLMFLASISANIIIRIFT